MRSCNSPMIHLGLCEILHKYILFLFFLSSICPLSVFLHVKCAAMLPFTTATSPALGQQGQPCTAHTSLVREAEEAVLDLSCRCHHTCRVTGISGSGKSPLAFWHLGVQLCEDARKIWGSKETPDLMNWPSVSKFSQSFKYRVTKCCNKHLSLAMTSKASCFSFVEWWKECLSRIWKQLFSCLRTQGSTWQNQNMLNWRITRITEPNSWFPHPWLCWNIPHASPLVILTHGQKMSLDSQTSILIFGHHNLFTGLY